jgi:hypothetical protein
VQDQPPEWAGQLNDPRVREKFSQILPHGLGCRRLGGAQVDEKKAQAGRLIGIEIGLSKVSEHLS